MNTDEVDRLLKMSDPAVDLTVKERYVASRMVDQSRRADRPRRYARPVAIGAIGAVLLGGGGMAAAAATGLWDGWAQDDALASLHYELPSGVSCELRVGNVQGAPDEVEDVIRQTLAGTTIDDADVARAAASLGESGDPSTDDEAYQAGYNWAINLRIEEALAAHNLDGEWTGFSGQGSCQ